MGISPVEGQRCAFITGASSGIGEAFAKRLAAKGWRVILVARRADALEKVLLGLAGSGHEYLSADLSTDLGLNSVDAFLQSNRVNLLVNCAGCGRYGTYHTSSWERQREIVQLNCHGLASIAHTYLRLAQPGDSLINVSSVAAFLPQPTSAAYAASKAFVTALSESLWFENRKRDVYVMALHPGITQTQFRERAGGKPDYGKSAQLPEEIVDIAMFQLKRRKLPSVICGTKYKLVTFLSRLVSRKSMVYFLGRTRSFDP